MISWLTQLDYSLFLAINTLPHGFWLDLAGLIFSFLGGFGFVWYFITFSLYFAQKGKKDNRFLLTMILAGCLSLFLVSLVIKPLVGRERPMVTLHGQAIVVSNRYLPETVFDFIDVLDEYAFPSGHATMAFAAVYVLSRKRPRSRIWFYLLASVIAFTRVYLGKHFPLDVVAGGLLGTGIGWVSTLVVGRK